MDNQQTPRIPEDLLLWLEKRHPRPLPTPGQSLDLMWVQVGQCKLVEHLRKLFNEQRQGPILEGPAP